MRSYLNEVREAVDLLISASTDEQRELNAAENILRVKEQELKGTINVVEFLHDNPDLDDEGIGTAEFWRCHFELSPSVENAAESLESIRKTIEVRRATLDALSCALLQIAKQGISIQCGGLTGCPGGRQIGSTCLRDVIWQGRNQAMHWDEGQLRASVLDCFRHLAVAFGTCFSNPQGKSAAFDVIRILGWSCSGSFESDMLSLVPP